MCYILMGLLALAALARIEWWPLSSFELFSRPRTGIVSRWEITVLDEAGMEQVLPIHRLARSFRGAHHVLNQFGRLPDPRRDEICRVYLQTSDRLGFRAERAWIYRVVHSRTADRSGRETGSRTLMWTCAQ